MFGFSFRPMAAAAAALTLCAAPAAAQNIGMAGTWRPAEPYKAAIQTADGKAPPMKAAAKRLYNKRIADRRAGKSGDGVEICLPPGTPRIMWQDRPFLIAITPKKVFFIHEYQHTHRHIYLDEKLPPDDELDFLYGGASAGRWDGDTLVIETAGFNDQTRLDEAGLPHSPQMKVTERLRLVDADTLEDVVTINDPANYTAPWTARVTFKRADGVELKEDICAEKLLDPALRAQFATQK